MNQEGADALTVDATSYALLAAVELGESKLADKIACWITTQENYLGGFKSTQVVWMPVFKLMFEPKELKIFQATLKMFYCHA